ASELCARAALLRGSPMKPSLPQRPTARREQLRQPTSPSTWIRTGTLPRFLPSPAVQGTGPARRVYSISRDSSTPSAAHPIRAESIKAPGSALRRNSLTPSCERFHPPGSHSAPIVVRREACPVASLHQCSLVRRQLPTRYFVLYFG